MSSLWTTKPSPGRGIGMFATQAIPSGTLILHDKERFRLKGVGFMTSYKVEEELLQRTVQALNASDKAKFYALHDGSRKHATKEMRIWKANAFSSDGGDDGYSFFDASRLNHSCVPNAEKSEEGEHPDIMDVYAMRDIAAGEEIFINYDSDLDFVTGSQRQHFLRVHCGFECRCACCAAGSDAVEISDARRKIINVLYWQLRNKVPPQWRLFDTISPGLGKRPRYHEDRDVPLPSPLPLQQASAYAVLYVAACEAEGLVGAHLAEDYQQAALLLFNQILMERPIVVLASVKVVGMWMLRAEEPWRKARGSEAPMSRYMFEKTQPLLTVDILLHDLLKNPKKADGMVRRSFAAKLIRMGSDEVVTITLDREECVAELRELQKVPGRQALPKPGLYFES